MPLGKLLTRKKYRPPVEEPRREMDSKTRRFLKDKLFHRRESAPCCFCKKALSRKTATLEHVVPRSAGGNWSVSNLRLSCKECNEERGNEDFTEFRNRKQRK